jgi:serine/threonine protein kinase
VGEPKGGRGFLLYLAAEAIAPVIGKCAEKHVIQVAGLVGGAVAGPAGAAVGAAAGFVVEKAINYFGPPIVNSWLSWLRGKPILTQIAAITQLGAMSPEESRRVATAAVEQALPAANAVDKAVAIEYLTAISGTVRRSLVTDRSGATTLPPTMPPDSEQTLLQLLPTDVPPYIPGAELKDTPYRLGNLVGTGGFGAVYRATDRFNQHLPMAIKFCLDLRMLDMLKEEEKNLIRLIKEGGQAWSSRIVRLYGSNFKHPTPYLVYEYIEGGDLAAYLSRIYHEHGRGMTPKAAHGVIQQITEALAFAHEHGLIHRDLKPANVLVSRESIKLADFGIGTIVAKYAIKNSRMGTSAVNQLSLADRVSLYRGAGTPLYMSPEQRRGEPAAPHHDLYSLGVMWYQLLVGDVTREFAQGWDDELAEEFSVPKEHIECIRLCTGRPSKRPANARDLLKHLGSIAEPPPVPAPPSPPIAEAIPEVIPVVEDSVEEYVKKLVKGVPVSASWAVGSQSIRWPESGDGLDLIVIDPSKTKPSDLPSLLTEDKIIRTINEVFPWWNRWLRRDEVSSPFSDARRRNPGMEVYATTYIRRVGGCGIAIGGRQLLPTDDPILK